MQYLHKGWHVTAEHNENIKIGSLSLIICMNSYTDILLVLNLLYDNTK